MNVEYSLTVARNTLKSERYLCLSQANDVYFLTNLTIIKYLHVICYFHVRIIKVISENSYDLL